MFIYIADLIAYQNRTNKNDTHFIWAVFRDNKDMKDMRYSRKIGLINDL